MNPSSSSFVISYLLNSCGLSEQAAIRASKKLKKFSTLDDAVRLIESYGFTKPDITRLISKSPSTLNSPQATLKPKLDYFFSKQVPRSDVIKIISSNPKLLHKRLEDEIKRCCDFLENLLGSDRLVFHFFQRTGSILKPMHEELILSNFQVLRDAGVRKDDIIKYFGRSPGDFMNFKKPDKFKDAVLEVKARGLDPAKLCFLDAVKNSVGTSETTREDRLNAYRKWGWTDEQLEILFKKQPQNLFVSARKVNDIMDILINQMGYSFSDVCRELGLITYKPERFIKRLTVYRYLISICFIEEGACSIRNIMCEPENVFLKRFVIRYEDKAPELWQVYEQAANKHALEEGAQGSVMEEEDDKSNEEEVIGAVPVDEKVLQDSQRNVLNTEGVLDKVKESLKTKRPQKVLKTSKKIVVEEQSRAAKKGEEAKSKEEEEIDEVHVIEKVVEDSQASILKKKVASDKVEELKTAKRHKKGLNKLKKKVEVDKAGKIELMAYVPMAGKVLEDCQASIVDKRVVSGNNVEEKSKAKGPKKVLMKKLKKNLDKGRGSKLMEGDDKSNETEEIDDVAVVEKFVEDNQARARKRKVASSKVEESKKAKKVKKVLKMPKEKVSSDKVEELKIAKRPEKVLKKLKKKVVEVQDKAEKVEEMAAVLMDGKVLEDCQASVVEKKLVLDEGPKKVSIKKQKIKVDKVRGSVKMGEQDKSNEAEEVHNVAGVEKVVEDSQARTPKRKVASSKVEEWKKAKKIISKLPKERVDEVQGNAVIKYVVEAPELSQVYKQASNRHVVEEAAQDSNMEEEDNESKEEEEICVVPMDEKVLEDSQASMLNRNVVLDKVKESIKTKRPKKVMKKSKKKVVAEQHSAVKKGEEGKSKKVMKKSKKKVVAEQNSAVKKGEEGKSNEEEGIDKVHAVWKVIEDNQASMLNKKVASDKVEVLKTDKRPKKVLKKLKKTVDKVQDSVEKEEVDKAEKVDEMAAVLTAGKVLEDCQASVVKKIVVLDRVEEMRKAKKTKKVLIRKLKKKVDEVHGSVKMGEENKSNEAEEIDDVAVVEKVVKDIQASTPKSKVASSKVKESKKAKKTKKVLKMPKENNDEVQGSAVIKYVIEAPELSQAANSCVMKDSQNEELTFCPERDTESVALLPTVEKVVDKNQVDEFKKKWSSSDIVEPQEECEEESKKAHKSKKVFKKLKKKVVEGSAMKDKREEEIVTVPNAGEVLVESQASVPKMKVASDRVAGSNNAERPKTKLKKKVVEVQGSTAKKENEDKHKKEGEIAAIAIVSKVLEATPSSVLKRKVALDKEDQSKKPKRSKTVVVEVQSSDLEKGEEDMSSVAEKVDDVRVPVVQKVVEGSQASVLKRKDASTKVEESKKAKKPKKVVKRPKKKTEEAQGNAPELLQAANRACYERLTK